MSQSITQRRVVYELPNEGAVVVRRDVEFHGADGDPLALDLYLPADAGESKPPAVVLVAGFPDPGYQRMLGCRFKETQGSVSWGRLLAASGLAAVAYTNREPVGDLAALMETLSRRGAALGIAEGKVGMLGTSGHAPLALSLLMNGGPAQAACAALLYGYTLDLDGATGVGEVAAKFGFANACAGRTTRDLRADAPVFLARAGKDQFPHLNASMDRLISQGLGLNLPLTLVNYPAGEHAFELMDASEPSRNIVRQTLAFLRQSLLP